MSKILVRATQVGYYGHERRYPLGHGHKRSGEPFYVEDILDAEGKVKIPAEKLVSKRWMERLNEKDVAMRRKMSEPAPRIEEPAAKSSEGPTGNKEVI